MDNNKKFNYTYSAKEQEEIKRFVSVMQRRKKQKLIKWSSFADSMQALRRRERCLHW